MPERGRELEILGGLALRSPDGGTGLRERTTRDRHQGFILHGTELAEGVEWVARRRLPDVTVEFVAASRRFQLSGLRRARRVTIALAALLAVAIAATGLAVWQQQNATAAEQVALSRQLAAQSAALLDVDYDLAALLSVKAYRTSPTREALSSLYSAASRPLLRRLVGHRRAVESVAFSPDGRTLATSSDDGTARLWGTGSGGPIGARRGDSFCRTTIADPAAERPRTWSTATSPRPPPSAVGRRLRAPRGAVEPAWR